MGEFLALEHGTEYSGYSIAHEAPVDGVDVSSGAAFARDRQSRSKPGCKQPPGADVGQYLVVCCPSNTVSEVCQDAFEKEYTDMNAIWRFATW